MVGVPSKTLLLSASEGDAMVNTMRMGQSNEAWDAAPAAAAAMVHVQSRCYGNLRFYAFLIGLCSSNSVDWRGFLPEPNFFEAVVEARWEAFKHSLTPDTKKSRSAVSHQGVAKLGEFDA